MVTSQVLLFCKYFLIVRCRLTFVNSICCVRLGLLFVGPIESYDVYLVKSFVNIKNIRNEKCKQSCVAKYYFAGKVLCHNISLIIMNPLYSRSFILLYIRWKFPQTTHSKKWCGAGICTYSSLVQYL